MLHAVIMAGGSGTRFWPLSRKSLPKQFITLWGDRTLIQQANDRVVGVVGAQNIHVVTNKQHTERVFAQLPELKPNQVIGEPIGRDTAPCIGLAAAILHRMDPNSKMMVLAADHVIRTHAQFHAAVRAADQFLDEHPQSLITFGIVPTRPATGYGYLRKGPLQSDRNSVNIFQVRSFHEKPDLVNAERFVSEGEYYWNSGMFCWKTATILEEIERLLPELRAGLDQIAQAWDTPNGKTIFESLFPQLTKISIDYGVMEKAREVAMVEAPFEWDDVGSWLALERHVTPAEGGNVTIGSHRGIETRNCVIVGESERLITTIGVEDLIIVQSGNVTLVAHRREEQAVRQLLARLESEGFADLL